MKKIFSKKGMKTTITLFAVLFIALVFVIFIALYKNAGKVAETRSQENFLPIQNQLILQDFLAMPAFSEGSTPDDLTPDIGNQVTHAELISWTCGKTADDRNFKILRDATNKFFTEIYAMDDWYFIIIYYAPSADINSKDTPRLTPVSFGTSVPSWMTPDALYDLRTINGRTYGGGSQIIPCIDTRYVAKVLLLPSISKQSNVNYG